jgi:hemerythrin-like domain-containing protein
MTGAPGDPADTTMMGVVHDALRRDLIRVDAALSHVPPPDRDRGHAIAAHVEWMMSFLHHHHQGEDTGLWPLVRSRAPATAGRLDAMQAQHTVILPAIDGLSAAARSYAQDTSDTARAALLGALSDLSAVLLPHLRQEEDEAMPLVSATITNAEWHEWDQKLNVKTKSLSQLGEEGHWLMDGLDRRRYDHLVHLVPPAVRAILLKGFARRYRTAARRRWGVGVDIGPLHRPVVT